MDEFGKQIDVNEGNVLKEALSFIILDRTQYPPDC